MATLPTKIDLNADRVPLRLVATSEGLARGLMQVVLLWSQFEDEFNTLLHALGQAQGLPAGDGWRSLPFVKRRDRYRDLVTAQFGDCPAVMLFLLEIERVSVVPFQQRNLLCHGRMVLDTRVPSLICTGRVGKSEQAQEFNATELQNLAWRLGRLIGLFAFLERTADLEAPHGASHEIPTLQAFLASHYWKPATPPNS